VTARGLVALALVAAVAAAVPARAAGGEGEDRAVLAQLEQRSKGFYDLLERGERERAAAAWPALAADLARFHDGLEERLGRMRDEVTERDGDLDELYRSPRWRDPEIMSLVAAYHLAWVRYQGAQLVGEPAKKRALLQKAIEGFSQFLLVNDVPEIYADSLYGRGLAFLDLGETAKAIEDLSAAAAEPRVGAKARAALEEARRRGSGKQGPAESDPEAQLARLGELLERTGGGDAAVEKDATQLARGIAVRGGTSPARVSSLVATKLGGGTPASVRSSYGLFLLAQLAIDRGRCGDVAPLAEASAGLHDAGRARHRPEILFLDAGCRLNAGQAREAADRFAALLREFPDGPRAREAAYYRFRALDVARTADPSLTVGYEEALTTYLSRYPAAEGGGEARYLLAELHRSAGDCKRAEAEYGAVGTGPFAARARLGALECRVAAVVKAGPGGREEVLAALRAFVREVPDRPLAARAALLGAVVAASATPPDHAAVIELLDGFEKRYPDAKDMHPRAVELRLGARVATGQLEGAERDLDAFLGGRGDEQDRRRTLSRLGRDLATRAERGPETERRTALALARKVYAALVQATGDPRDRIMLADLELKAGDAAAARRLYEEVLAKDGSSAEAIRGAAHAAAALGDRDSALAYWRAVLDSSTPGGTAWYEARLAQVTLLAGAGRKAQACELLRGARGRATSVGGDQMEGQLRAMEPEVCR
jgi:tetratricopeptide (TPR) repeat protein